MIFRIFYFLIFADFTKSGELFGDFFKIQRIFQQQRNKLTLSIDFYGVCVFDDPNDRVLDGHYFSSQEMTIEMCLATCRQKGFLFSGLEWQIECYCGNQPTKGFKWAWSNKCNERCSGNSNQVCGGSHALSVYTS